MEKLIKKFSSIEPTSERLIEGDLIKVGWFKYTDLLKDNNKQNYKIDWGKINTNVDSLIALVDFTKSVQEVLETVNNNSSNQTEDLKLMPEHTHNIIDLDSANNLGEVDTNIKSSEIESQKKYTLIYIICSIIALTIGYFVIAKIRNK